MADWHAEARRLRAEGLTLREIGERFGVTIEAARLATNDAAREKQKTYQRERYRSDPAYRAAHIEKVRRAQEKRKAREAVG